MKVEDWTEVARGLSIPSLRELHASCRDALNRGAVDADFVLQARVFERELEKRREPIEPI